MLMAMMSVWGCESVKMLVILMIMLISYTCSAAAAAADAYISLSALQTHQSPRFPARSLLQAQKPCPINFENQNYTIITSKCKGPRFPQTTCCSAFKEFACPFADQLNDLNNMCAQTMFSYINLNGGYPPGLFANECTGSKRGLECPAVASGANTNALHHCGPLMWLLAAVIFLVFHQLL